MSERRQRYEARMKAVRQRRFGGVERRLPSCVGFQDITLEIDKDNSVVETVTQPEIQPVTPTDIINSIHQAAITAQRIETIANLRQG